MDHELERNLADNAKQWLALSRSISSAEKHAFITMHDGFLSIYGADFMVRVYRATLHEAMQNMPEAERAKLLSVFQQVLDQALEEPRKAHHG